MDAPKVSTEIEDFINAPEQDEDETPSDDESADSGIPPEKKDPAKNPEDGDSELEEDADEPSEPMIPLHRVKQILNEKRELEAKITLSQKKPDDQDADQKARIYLKGVLKEVLEEEKGATSAAQEALAQEIVDLQEIYGAFDVDKVLDLKEKYHTDTEGALALFFEQSKAKPVAPKPIIKESKPKADAPAALSETPKNTQNMTLEQVVRQAKKDYGLS